MIARANRFKGYGGLRYVYKKGSSARSQFFNVRYTHNQRRETYRLAVVVSRKVNKSAVKRNRIRRRLYEVFRLLANDFTGPYDMVCTVYSDQILQSSHDELMETVRQLLKQAGIIDNKTTL